MSPAGFHCAVIGLQHIDDFAQADRVRSGHRLDKRWEEIVFLIGMVVQGGCVEVAHQADCRRTRRVVIAVGKQVRNQAPQGRA